MIKLLEAAGSKDLYIAIPGIGMLSLGKINLDNYKIDQKVVSLTVDYFLMKRIEQSNNKSFYDQVIRDFKLIYSEMKETAYFSQLRNVKDQPLETKSGKQRLGNLIKSMLGSDPTFGYFSERMNEKASSIFIKLNGLAGEEKAELLKRELKNLMLDRQS